MLLALVVVGKAPGFTIENTIISTIRTPVIYTGVEPAKRRTSRLPVGEPAPAALARLAAAAGRVAAPSLMPGTEGSWPSLTPLMAPLRPEIRSSRRPARPHRCPPPA